MNYFDIYKLRMNRYGLDYQSRIQNLREKQFDNYLLKTIYRVDFEYEGHMYAGSFERYSQNETKSLHYLLVPTNLNMPGGTVLMIPNKDDKPTPWMVYYLETIEASGYNRYIMLHMTHYLTWVGRDGLTHNSWAYMYGQEDNMLKDEFKARSRMDTVYNENLKSSFFVMPTTEHIRKDDYLIIGEKPLQEYYRVTGYDFQSTQGVEYVTIDPVYEYDLTPAPPRPEEAPEEDWYWLEYANIPQQQPEGDN